MSFDTLLFTCAICEREVRDYPHRNAKDRHIEPVCRMCERGWTERSGKPTNGAMMDRRKTMHILALSNALHNTAAIKNWETIHARA